MTEPKRSRHKTLNSSRSSDSDTHTYDTISNPIETQSDGNQITTNQDNKRTNNNNKKHLRQKKKQKQREREATTRVVVRGKSKAREKEGKVKQRKRESDSQVEQNKTEVRCSIHPICPTQFRSQLGFSFIDRACPTVSLRPRLCCCVKADTGQEEEEEVVCCFCTFLPRLVLVHLCLLDWTGLLTCVHVCFCFCVFVCTHGSRVGIRHALCLFVLFVCWFPSGGAV